MSRDRAMAGALALVLFIGYLLRVFALDGVLDGDEIAHYLHIRFIPGEWATFLDRWGRPAFAGVYLPGALLSLTAARVESVLLAVVTVWVTYRTCRTLRLEPSWLAVPLTGLQPAFVAVASACVPEMLFSLTMALFLQGILTGSPGRASLMAAVAPLVRFEGALVTMGWAAVLSLRHRRTLAAGLVVLPLLAWNVYWVFQATPLPYYRPPDPLDLLFPFDVVFRSGSGDYTTGSLGSYPARLPGALGPAVVVLAVAGTLVGRKGRAAGILAAVFVILYTGLHAFVPAAAVAGYERHVASVSPLVSVAAVAAVDRFLPKANRRRFAVSTAVVVLVAVTTVPQLRWPAPRMDQRAAREVAHWIRQEGLEDRRILASNIWIHYFLDRGPYRLAESPLLHRSLLSSLEAGDLIVWDSRFAEKSWIQVPRERLRNGPYRELRRFPAGPWLFVIYERT